MLNSSRPLLISILILLLQPGLVGAVLAQQPPAIQLVQQGNTSEDDKDERRIKRLGDAPSDEWQPGLRAPDEPAGSQQENEQLELPDPEQNAELNALLSRLAARPGNREAMSELDSLLGRVIAQAHEEGDRENADAMRRLLNVVQNVNPRKSGLVEAFDRLEAMSQVQSWLNQSRKAKEQGNLIMPPGNNALEWAERVLQVNPDKQEALALLLEIQQGLVDRALKAAEQLDFDSAEEWLYEASLVAETQSPVEDARNAIAEFRVARRKQIEEEIDEAINAGDFDLAEFVLIDLIALTGNNPRVAELRQKLKSARAYGQYKPGQVIQFPLANGMGSAPAVVVIPPGSFLMGSEADEEGRSANEGPRHRVTFQTGFAIGLQEVTVGQFRTFIEASRYRTDAEKLGSSKIYDEQSGRISEREGVYWIHDFQGNRAADNDPVLHVSWHDARAFVDWLSESTGKHYRLPSEAEFEYVLRAGTVTRYWWGDGRPETAVENLTGERDESANGRVWTSNFRRYGDGFWGPAPGASFPPNPWGLHDLAGNVSEWIDDCWHETYARAPDDGSAWINPGCTRKVIRGGYWASAPDQSRSAARLSASERLSGPRVGFRVALSL